MLWFGFQPFQGGTSFVDPFYFVFAFAILACLACLCHAALWSPAGSPVCDEFLCFCHIPIRYPGSGVVLDCIDS